VKVSLTGVVTLENGAAVLGEDRLPGRQGRLVLAYLVAEHGRPVPRDELSDVIWNGSPPETWEKALAGIISKLRDVLDDCGVDGAAALTHAFGCYRLKLPDESSIDVAVAEAAAADATAALASGDPSGARKAAQEAAAIARRPFLPGEDGDWVEGRRRHLRDIQVRALECLADALLALDAPVESARSAREALELEPFRESAYNRLMLALARAGNDAEALRVYEQCRRLLADELGTVPSRELQQLHVDILRTRTRPAAATLSTAAVGRSTRRRARVLAALAVTAGGSALAVATLGGGGRAEALGRVANGLAAYDVTRGSETGELSLGFSAGGLATADGDAWATNPAGGTLLRVDGRTHAVRATIRVGLEPEAVAAGAGSIWVVNGGGRTVARINPATDAVVQTISVGNGPSAVAAGAQGVWVANRLDGTVTAIDSKSGRRLRTVAIGSLPSAVALAAGSVWVADEGSAAVWRLDAHDGTVREEIGVGNGPDGLAAGGGAVWVANSLDGTVSRIDPSTDAVVATARVGAGPLSLAADGSHVWVAAEGSDTLTELDPATAHVRRTVRLASAPRALAAGPTLWLAGGAPSSGHSGGTVRVVDPSPGALDSIDPALGYAPTAWSAESMEYDGLVGFERSGGSPGSTLVPDLAVALPRPADAGRTYIFRLRRGIRYSDGTPLRAADVRRAIERILALRSPGSAYYRRIVGASSCRPHRCRLERGIAVDDRLGTVAFHLTSADPAFLYELALPFAGVVPASTPIAPARAPLPGTGPYRIARYVPGKLLRLVRNARFREWSHAAQPEGYPDAITWSLGGSSGTPGADVALGRADVFESRPPDARVEELFTRLAPQVHVFPVAATFFVSLNTRLPPFDDVRARRALALAVDRGRVARLLQGPLLAQTTCQFLPPGMPGYEPFCPFTAGDGKSGRWQAPDVRAARRLVRASGTVGARVVVWEFPRFAAVGRYLVDLLNRVGYRATIRIEPPQRFFADGADSSKRVQASAFYWQADYPAASELLMPFTCASFVPHSPLNINVSEFCDRAVDAAVSARRWAIADRRLVLAAPAVPLVNFRAMDLVSRRFRNYERHPVYGVLLDQAWVR
jgi:YVTN family beta-propeller protein